MKTISFPNSEKVTLVDDEDFERLSKHKWVLNGKYACRQSRGKTLRMAREIMNCPKDFQVDHINRNTLDNRKINLRLVKMVQNVWNSGSRVTSHTGVKGVGWHKYVKKFQARANHLGRMHHFGYFDTIEEAAEVYNREIFALRGVHGAKAEIKLK